MAFIGIRELSRDTSRIIREFEESGEPVVVTREGRPIGALVPVDQAQLQDLALATAEQFRAPSVASGGGGGETRSLQEAAAERGIVLEEAEEPELLEEVDAGSELASVTQILREPLAEQVLSAANAEIGAINRETLAAVDDENLEESEVRELTSATAALYAQLLRRYLVKSLAAAEAAEAPEAVVLDAGQSAGITLRVMNRAMLGSPHVDRRHYGAALRAVEAAAKSRVTEQAEAEARADLTEPAF